MTVCFFLVLRLFISFQMEEEKIITWHPERKCKTILMKSPVFFLSEPSFAYQILF